MGTRSLTTFNSSYSNEEIVVMYRQYDGYPTGHGKELLEFLKGMTIVNGISAKENPNKFANGINQFFPTMLKTRIGDMGDELSSIYDRIKDDSNKDLFFTFKRIFHGSLFVD